MQPAVVLAGKLCLELLDSLFCFLLEVLGHLLKHRSALLGQYSFLLKCHSYFCLLVLDLLNLVVE